jgi:hypothetical protein
MLEIRCGNTLKILTGTDNFGGLVKSPFVNDFEYFG